MNLYIAPHPPIIIGEIGKGEESKAQRTIDGLNKIAEDIASNKPSVIAVITPHGNVFQDALCVHLEEDMYGDFSRFSHPELKYSFKNDVEKVREICLELGRNNINNIGLNKKTAAQYGITADVDHGALVPLHFILKKHSDFKLIHISIGFLSTTQLYQAGGIVAEILGDKNVIIASGDMSHMLSYSSPNGFSPMGEVYDNLIVEAVVNCDFLNILNADEKIVNKAGQCAQKPLEMFIGALEGYEMQSEVYSYQGPYGVGYMTAKITRGEESGESLLKQYLKEEESSFIELTESEDEYVSLASKTIREYILNENIIKIPEGLNEKLYEKGNGVFVSIKKNGHLRGCIGTISGTKNNIAEEIVSNAVSAATRDPRFEPIDENELSVLEISVDILSAPEDIKSKEELDVKKYGVIVTKGYKRGLLLPNLEGVDTLEYQIAVALKKAGIRENEKYSLQRFTVERHK